MAAKRVAFINGKGGCGKTTCIFHIAGVLAKQGEKVLVIDLDKQRNASQFLLANSEFPPATVLDFMLGNATAEEATGKALFQTRGNAKPKYFNVDCMVGEIRLEDEDVLSGIDGDSVEVRLDEFIEAKGYTWVLVDMPPSSHTINKICFRHIVDYCMVPLSSDDSSISGYSDLIDVIDKAREINPTLQVLGIFLSRYYPQSQFDNYLRETLSALDTFIDVQITHRICVRDAVIEGRPISFYTFSESRREYERLVKEMIRRAR